MPPVEEKAYKDCQTFIPVDTGIPVIIPTTGTNIVKFLYNDKDKCRHPLSYFFKVRIAQLNPIPRPVKRQVP